MTTDFSSILIDGPWRHAFVPANGTRFHVAEAGPSDPGTPLVLLLHSFPQFWWTWRHQLTGLAEAGYRVAAMDLRGVGASDKPPLGYDALTRTRDAAGVVRSLGAQSAVVMGHGLGGLVAWSMPTLQPSVTDAVVAISSPHPARLHRRMRAALTPAAARYGAFMQIPALPEKALATKGLAKRLITEASCVSRSEAELDTYDDAMKVPFAAHGSVEAMRWLARSAPRTDGRRYLSVVRRPIAIPAMQIHGTSDAWLHTSGAELDAAALCRDFRFETIESAGHFVHEESPERVNPLLLEFLESKTAGQTRRP